MPPVALLVPAGLVALLCVLPVAYVISDTFSGGWTQARELIVRDRVGVLLGNTGKLVVLGTSASLVLGTALGWLLARTDLPLRRFWLALLAAPLAIPAFVTSYGWVSLTTEVQTLAGAVLVTTLAYFPLVMLPVAATLRGLDPALEESARSLGHGGWAVFFRVVLPQLRPALLGGGLLVALHLLAEYGALELLRYQTFTTAIYNSFEAGETSAAVSALASVLLLLCVVVLVFELRLRGYRRYARLGAGSARTLEPLPLGRARIPALLGVLGVVVLSIGVPMGSLVRWLTTATSTPFPTSQLVDAATTSLTLGLMAAALTTLMALPVAILAVRHRGGVTTALERTTYLATALPGIVIALALAAVSLDYAPGIYQTTTLLLVAYAVLFLPRAVVSLRAALAQAPSVLDDVAHSLGAGTVATMLRVTLPLIARGLGAGAALVFLGTVTELTATLLLAPLGTETLATRFWTETGQIAYAAAAPYAALMVVLSAPATFLLTREVRRSSAL